MQNLDTSFGGDDGDGLYGEYGDDDGYDGNQENQQPLSGSAGADNQLPPAQAGLGINLDRLVQADRKVEKIEIG